MSVAEKATTTKHQRTREESAARKARAAALKTEIDKWVEVLGGWDAHGLKTDLAVMGVAFSDEPLDQSYMQASLSMLTTQGTMGDPAYNALSKVNDHFKAAGIKNAQKTYISAIRSAHGHETPEIGQDWPFTVLLIPISKLFADENYQRPIHEPFIRELLIKFDERLVGTIDVSQRTTSKFAILDGRQRVETMKQLGKTSCWCSIYTDMTVPEEAAFFYHKNRDRKQMAYYYAFRARVLSGDSTASIIQEIVEAQKFKLGVVTDNLDVIGAVRSVEEVYAIPSELWPNVLTPTLEVLRSCFYGRMNGLDGSMIRGLGRFFAVYGKGDIQWKHWEDALRGLGPQLVLGRARDREDTTSAGGKIGTAVATTLAEIHNSGLPKGERLNLDRLPKPIKKRSPRRSS